MHNNNKDLYCFHILHNAGSYLFFIIILELKIDSNNYSNKKNLFIFKLNVLFRDGI